MNVLKVFFEYQGWAYGACWCNIPTLHPRKKEKMEVVEMSASKNPFENDYTGSFEKISHGLTSLVDFKSEESQFVLSIDGIWGAGKTTFIDMWRQDLIKSGRLAIKFDAWKHDYIQDPLGTFIANLSQQLSQISSEKEKVKKLRSCGIKVIKAFARFGLTTLMKHAKIDETGKDLIDNLSKINYKNEDHIMEAYENSYAILNDFKKALKDISKNETIFIFIDELDRCKPVFSIEIFEIIKHIIDVKNVCCILSTNVSMLSSSIAHFYGYQPEEARNYLDRIIDVQFSLPKPEIKKFISGKIEKIFNNFLHIKDKEFFDEMISICCSHIKSLRNIEKYFSDAEVFLSCNKYSKSNNVPEIYYSCILHILAINRLENPSNQKGRLHTELQQNKKYKLICEFFDRSNSITKIKEKLEEVRKEINKVTYSRDNPNHPCHILEPILEELKIIYDYSDGHSIKKYVDYNELAYSMIHLLHPIKYE